MRRDAAGFRLRGLAMTRIETFTDAAFAFSLTLLVISLDPPATMAALEGALRQIPAFLLSASLLMVFWAGHHSWSRRFGMDDATTIVLSCLLVFTVLVYIHPLRFMFSAMTAWIARLTDLPIGPPGDSLGIRSLRDVNRMFVLYGLGFVAMSASIALLNLHAWRHRGALGLDALERQATLSEVGSWCILIAVGLASALVAAVFPDALPVAGWAYALLAVIMPLYGGRARRRAATAALRSGTPAARDGAVFASTGDPD
ncbi:MAG TPA: TMEM175 family protein [Longimicrobiales bacterium]